MKGLETYTTNMKVEEIAESTTLAIWWSVDQVALLLWLRHCTCAT